MVNFALLISKVVQFVPLDQTRFVEIRIGLHVGDAVGGITGKLTPRYCFFGDTINVASRMETTGMTNRIHVSGDFASHVKILPQAALYHLEKRVDIVDVKGKGKMTTYWLECSQYYDIEYSYSKLIKSVQQLTTDFIFVKPELLSIIARNGTSQVPTSQSITSSIPLRKSQPYDAMSHLVDPVSRSISPKLVATIDFSELIQFDFDLFRVPTDDAISISSHILSLFEGLYDLNGISIEKRVLSNFIRRVSRSYKAVPYHNYHHAFAVLQFTAAQLVQCNFVAQLPNTELFCLSICALIHDIGNTNYYCYYFISDTNITIITITTLTRSSWYKQFV